jgi:hypothetical protein
MARECPNLDTIFCTAIVIASVEDRAAYISQACGGDHELRGQVDRLLDTKRLRRPTMARGMPQPGHHFLHGLWYIPRRRNGHHLDRRATQGSHGSRVRGTRDFPHARTAPASGGPARRSGRPPSRVPAATMTYSRGSEPRHRKSTSPPAAVKPSRCSGRIRRATGYDRQHPTATRQRPRRGGVVCFPLSLPLVNSRKASGLYPPRGSM